MTASTSLSFGVYAELDGIPESARDARTLVRDALGSDHPSADDATLIISELVGNAIAHSRSGQPDGTVIVAIETAQQDSVLLQVRDLGSRSAPREQAAASNAEHGRGLAIVSQLATNWGSHASRAGRITWCRITPHQGQASPSADVAAAPHSAKGSDPAPQAPAAAPRSRPRRERAIPEREAG